jgi:hypothetical protein
MVRGEVLTAVLHNIHGNFRERPVLIIQSQHFVGWEKRSETQDEGICCRIGWSTDEDAGFRLNAKNLKDSLDDCSAIPMSDSRCKEVHNLLKTNLVLPVPGGPLMRYGTGD